MRYVISTDGAALIAQVIPVALLVVGFEIQRAPTLYATGRMGTVGLWVIGGILVISLGLGFIAEKLCLEAVASSKPLNELESAIVWVALNALGYGAFLLLLGSLLTRLGVLERIAERAGRKRRASPRRQSRMLTYIEDHHPSSRN